MMISTNLWRRDSRSQQLVWRESKEKRVQIDNNLLNTMNHDRSKIIGHNHLNSNLK